MKYLKFHLFVVFILFTWSCETPKPSTSEEPPEMLATQQSRVIMVHATRELEQGNYIAASEIMNELLLLEEQIMLKERVQAYMLKSRIELAFNRQDNARFWLRKLYKYSPDIVLDPAINPPQMIAIWQAITTSEKDLRNTNQEDLNLDQNLDAKNR